MPQRREVVMMVVVVLKNDVKCQQRSPSSSSSYSSSSPSPAYCDVTKARDYHTLCEAVRDEVGKLCGRNCQTPCKTNAKVCGMDGVTYANECQCRCHHVPVDYYSPCYILPHFIDATSSKVTCPKVTCSKNNLIKGCQSIIPPGACCPICASELRMLINKRLATTLRMNQENGITLSGLADNLESLLSVRECRIYVYISMDGDLVVLVTPSNQFASNNLVQACQQEASHIANMISTNHPTIRYNAYLSLLSSAHHYHNDDDGDDEEEDEKDDDDDDDDENIRKCAM
ncbi:hypothetical protein HELRODRAFT_192935 [Helobdella robusta]|uniref:Kazal-like domain-containing protein n=1 Tax=Helobdella robusta TaxID=6412 RepID=T1FUF7_HELRO|nr:hypothetical protein HELRODRAFT_192935 [Helobdella robusta]ESN98466.1 hypothetical protein HELRODRAFT_192935 [Helobdella robusta]